ncbi:hypothetical protein F4818DRAFT_62296 [Hypoxylon cercidicola]|nr:hypothetical protein F4818DRAFT_62296 [Hypoxylon cercidicola]
MMVSPGTLAQPAMARGRIPARAMSAAAPTTPLREIQLSDRINHQPMKSNQAHHSLSGFSSKVIEPATPPDFEENQHFDSFEAAASPAYSWDLYQPYITDPKLDVLNSPSLPKNFVAPSIVLTPATPSPPSARSAYSTSSPTRLPRQSILLLDTSKQEPFSLTGYRGPSVYSDWGSDPFTDSGDDSDDSDATITPASYSSSVVAHRTLSLLRTPQAKEQNGLLYRQPATRYLIPGLVKAQLDYLEDSDSDFSDEEGGAFVTHAEMAPNYVAKNGTAELQAVSAGPPLGTIKVGHQFILESHIRRTFAETRLDAAREANYRLQGVQVIETTREALLLPVKTYNAACTFYHRFRLEHPTPDYNHTEAALASLFVACKVEDTLKKSREILCAHHNLKNPDHQTTQDDKIFDAPSKIIIGLERYIVEAINFDFRVRYPQKVLAKIVKKVQGRAAIVSPFFVVAFKMSIDIYKTYAPLKHSSATCALVIAQLTSLITNTAVDEFQALDPLDWHTDEQSVTEVMLDLLDLYTQHGKATKIGPMFDLQAFIDTQITVNRHVDRASLSRYIKQCRDCDTVPLALTPSTGSPMSLNTPTAAGSNAVKRGTKGIEGGTTRFVFDADQAANEKQAYNEYTKDSWEEWEEEFEEPISEPRDDRRDEPRGPRGPRGRGHGRGHGRGGFDSGWTPRNRHDRRRGRGFY